MRRHSGCTVVAVVLHASLLLALEERAADCLVFGKGEILEQVAGLRCRNETEVS